MPTTAAEFSTRLMVGLEIHVELATRTKMFTSAPNVAHPDNFTAAPNTLCDPVVLGLPGVLPVLNQEAVEMAMLVGLALGCKIARCTKWDRKSYYYPDLPKNYQISQYDQPLCSEGAVEIPASNAPDAPAKTIRIIRAHLEEDAGKLLHEAPGGYAIDYSIVDLNRAGTPLLEIVTYPDFETAEQVVSFAQMLRDICRALGVTEGIMQKGHMRFEPNINVVITRAGQIYQTPIVEIKNLNSFKAVAGAVQYEFARQVEAWQATGRVMSPGSKSTRGWDDATQQTFLQREKEDAHDYRYFPDPDLVPVVVDDVWLEKIRGRLVELPRARKERYVAQLGLSPTEAQIIIDEPRTCAFFEAILAAGVDAKRAAAILLNNLAKQANDLSRPVNELGVTPVQIKQVVDLLDAGKISSTAANQLLGLCCDNPQASVGEIAQKCGLFQINDTGALDDYINQILANPRNAKTIADIKAGKGAAVGALVGQVMKLSKGQANPKLVGEMIAQKLA